MRVVMTLCLFAAFMGDAFGQSQSEKPKISDIRRIYVQDQRDRGVSLSAPGEPVKPPADEKPHPSLDAATQMAHDAARREQVRALMASGGLTTAQDFHDAAFVFQHGDKPDDYLLAHILAVEAIAKGDSNSVWISAATLDRYLQNIGQKQVFGTQFLNNWWAYYLQHKKDSDLDAKLKTVSMDVSTQEPYDQDLLSDAMREVFCVPSLASQKQQVDDLNHDKPSRPTPVKGCHR